MPLLELATLLANVNQANSEFLIKLSEGSHEPSETASIVAGKDLLPLAINSRLLIADKLNIIIEHFYRQLRDQ